MSENEIDDYIQYTGPARFDKAAHSLEGLLIGITADSKVDDKEISSLIEWLSEHAEFANRFPFSEVIGLVNSVVDSRRISDDERADLLWLCNRFSTENTYYSAVTSDLQRLQGIVAGILANSVIAESEIIQLQKWMEEREHLVGSWPFDELNAVLMSVMADGRIDEKEHEFLTYFFSDFTNSRSSRTLENPLSEDGNFITGVCAVCPDVEFSERSFCFTGKSDRGPRELFKQHVEQRNGRFQQNVTNSTDYLIIGAGGNPCWAYSCYGRKVEKAVELRKAGKRILMVHEFDFWDAVEDS